jgi:hypothetical protein
MINQNQHTAETSHSQNRGIGPTHQNTRHGSAETHTMKSQHHQQPNTNQTHTQNRTILGQNQHIHTTGRSRNPYTRIPKTHTHLIGKQQGFTYPAKAGKKHPQSVKNNRLQAYLISSRIINLKHQLSSIINL